MKLLITVILGIILGFTLHFCSLVLVSMSKGTSITWTATYCQEVGCPAGTNQLHLSGQTRNTTCPPSVSAKIRTNDPLADDIRDEYTLLPGSCQVTTPNSQ